MRGWTTIGVGLCMPRIPFESVDEAVLFPASRFSMALLELEDRSERQCQLSLRAGTLIKAIALEVKVHCLERLRLFRLTNTAIAAPNAVDALMVRSPCLQQVESPFLDT